MTVQRLRILCPAAMVAAIVLAGLNLMVDNQFWFVVAVACAIVNAALTFVNWRVLKP